MLEENILWGRTFSPTGKVEREPTFLGAILIVVFGSVAGVFLGLRVGWVIAGLR
jgi:hypothetical protein